MFILVAIIFDKLLVSPLCKSIKESKEELSLKSDLLKKYNSVIGMKVFYEKKLDELKVSYNNIEEQLFSYKTEDLAQAKIQEFVKNIAKKNGIIVSRSSKRGKGRVISENPRLMLVYTNFEIKDADKIKKVQSFLYDIEYEVNKHISIEDLKIRNSGFGMSKGVSITITLSSIAKLEVDT